ncbi:MAG: T9SS type A sorting domain-containing protein [Bacteroidales bacterium]|nr:T9SS type A sorting domain-containing protein [Bacteroidales bacterium]
MKANRTKNFRIFLLPFIIVALCLAGISTNAQESKQTREVIPGYAGWAGNPDSLNVYIDDTWTEAEKDSVRAGISRWNNAGCEPKFKEVSNSADANITITQGDPGEGNAGLITWHENEEGKVTDATITIAEDTSPLSIKEVVTHELGHAIGLNDTDEAANGSDVMKGSGPSNGSDGNLSQHDSTEMRQAAASITLPGEDALPEEKAIMPDKAVFPGEFTDLLFGLPGYYPPETAMTVTPFEDTQVFLEYAFLEGDQLWVGAFTDPLHPSGKVLLDITIDPPFEDPFSFRGYYFVNINPVPQIDFECPFEIIQFGNHALVKWRDYHTYPFANPLRALLLMDGNSYFNAKPNNDFLIPVEPGFHGFTLWVDDYQVNSTSYTIDKWIGSINPPWEDNFEDYAVGSQIVGLNGWEFWFAGSASTTALITNENSHSGLNALQILGNPDFTGDDIVHQFNGCNADLWRLSAWQFIPQQAVFGSSYITLLNSYGLTLEDCNWSTQLKFDTKNNLVESDFEGATLPLLKGQWVEIEVIVDFNNDTQTISYNGEILTSKSWTEGILPAGLPDFVALDLFSGDVSEYIYYDDISLMPYTPQVTGGMLKVGDWLHSEDWHRWIGGSDGVTKVEFYPEQNEGILYVEFYYSIAGIGEWILFGSDENGQSGLAPGSLPSGTTEVDGWSGYLDHSMLPDENADLEFMARVFYVDSFFDVFTEFSTKWDVTPPSSVTTNLYDFFITNQPYILLEVLPDAANILNIEIAVEPKQEYFEKGIPPAQQPGGMDCGPTALAACLKYFESHGHPDVCGGYSLAELIEWLKNYCKTDSVNGTWDTDLEKGALEWINAHGGGFTVRRIPFNWKTMRDELERCQDIITLFRWNDGGHFMTFNSVSNRPEPDGRIRIDFMDPWTGENIDGYVNPETGTVDGFTDSQGNSVVPDGSAIFSTVIICPKESSINPGTGTIIPGPVPVPYPIPIETPGLYWIRIQIIDEDGNKSRLDYPVEYVSQAQLPHELVLVPNGKTNPEPWYQWISGVDNVTPVNLQCVDPDNQIAYVNFFFTQNPDLSGWQLFCTDTDGSSNAAPSNVQDYLPERDGWCAYLEHAMLLHELSQVYFMAEAVTSQGETIAVLSDATLQYDPTPPDSYVLNIENGFITDQDFLNLVITPIDANIDYVFTQETDSLADVYDKNFPLIQQPDSFSCGPASIAMCLKYFVNHDSVKYAELTGNLSDNDLMDSLKSYMGTTAENGTTENGMYNGITRWINNHGGGFSVNRFKPFSEFGLEELNSHLVNDGVTNGVSQDMISMFEMIKWVGDSCIKTYHYMTMSSVHETNVAGHKRFDYCDPDSARKLIFDVDENGLTSNWEDEEGYQLIVDDTIKLRSTLMICPNEPSIVPAGGQISEGPDPEPIPVPMPHSGRTAVRVRVVDEDGNKAEEDIEVIRVRPAEFPPGDIQIGLDAPPFKLLGGIPEGGQYAGPHVIDGWFYPNQEGIFPIIYAFTYTNGFVTTTTFTVTVIAADFGDAPETYPTLLADNGARHILGGQVFMGSLIDSEPDGQPNANATGDDLKNLADEDGISFGLIKSGSPAQITLTTSIAGFLQGWMDFNQDGDWDDANEQIFTDEYIHFPSTVCLNFMVPSDASEGAAFARFRFATFPGLPYFGSADNGEVEDYLVNIIHDQGIKWQQEPCPENSGLHCHDYISMSQYLYAIIADDWLCTGGQVTAIQWWGNYEAIGSGIDHFHLSIHQNDPQTCLPLGSEIWGMDVPFGLANETNTGEFNNEGKIIYQYEYLLNVPFDQIAGQTYWLDICAYAINPENPAIWRWQESDRSTVSVLCPAAYITSTLPWTSYVWNIPQPTRYSDMAFVITSQDNPPDYLDFGDAPDEPYPTLLANNGARHIVDGITYLGNSVDAEPDGQPNLPATGDDIANVADEDGVVFRTPLVQGKPTTIKVLASVDGVLNVWLDIDRNNTWAEAIDHVFTDLNLSAGWNTLTLNVPAFAAVGNSYMRFRFDSQGGLNYYGSAENGEVEDYMVRILPEGWGYFITPSTHTILVPLTTSIIGTNLSVDDAIGVFYTDDNGDMACGGAQIWDGVNDQVVLANGDDNTNIPKDGFDTGETLTWKLYHAATGIEEFVTVSYNPALPQSNGQFVPYGLSGLTSISGLSVSATATPAGVCEGDVVQLDAIVTGGSGSPGYLWSSVPPGFISNIKNPTDTPAQDITYNVLVTDVGISVAASVDVAVQPLPQANAGSDATICETDNFTLAAAWASNYSAIAWVTSGDGVFNDPTSLNPTYAPGSADISLGSVDLTMSVDPILPCIVYNMDMLTLSIIKQATAVAGIDATICPGDTHTLSGAATDFSAVLWLSSGDGIFDNPSDLGTGYTPGATDIQLGYVNLCLQAYPISPCLLEAVDCLDLYIREEQTVFLFEGWNGLSSYLLPYNSNNNYDLFNPILNHLIVAYNFESAFWPGIIDTLNWVDTSGYVVKMAADDQMIFCGEEISDKVLQLVQNWNLIPVLSKTNVDVTQIFNAIADVKIVLEVAGWKVYWPEYNINTIVNLEVGKSYFVFMNSAGTIDFTNSSGKMSLNSEPEFINISPWEAPAYSPGSHIVAFSPDALGQLAIGDVIGSFTSAGNCAGLANFDGNSLGLVVTGDDVYTPQVEGFENDEMMSFKVFRSATGEFFDLLPTFEAGLDASGRFHNFSISAINQLKLSPAGISNISATEIRIYPNPSSGTFNLEGISEETQVVIFNAFGDEILHQTTTVSTIIILNTQPKGVYLIRLQTLNGMYYQKIIIN